MQLVNLKVVMALDEPACVGFDTHGNVTNELFWVMFILLSPPFLTLVLCCMAQYCEHSALYLRWCRLLHHLH